MEKKREEESWEKTCAHLPRFHPSGKEGRPDYLLSGEEDGRGGKKKR